MKRITTVLLVLSVALGLPCLAADESPDAQVNPQTSVIEIADPVWAVDNYDILYVVAPGERSRSTSVTTHPADDLRPRMTIAPDGDAYVVWRRDAATTQVLIRRHNHTDDSWSAESVLSGADLPARDPEIVHDGSDPWVAFTEKSPLEVRIKVGVIQDEPDPFGVVAEIASTDHDGEIELGLNAASGHLWVTWTDSDLDVAWAEYDYNSATWSIVDYESYAGDSTKQARERIRNTVLGN